MLVKYVRLWVLENPKNIPWESKLKIVYNRNYGHDQKKLVAKILKTGRVPEETSDPFYVAYFMHNSGTLKSGSNEKTTGRLDCKVYNSMSEVKNSHVEIYKDWGVRELKKLYTIKVLCPFNRIAVELAVRYYLVKMHKYRKFYDGLPFARILPLLWKGKRVN